MVKKEELKSGKQMNLDGSLKGVFLEIDLFSWLLSVSSFKNEALLTQGLCNTNDYFNVIEELKEYFNNEFN